MGFHGLALPLCLERLLRIRDHPRPVSKYRYRASRVLPALLALVIPAAVACAGSGDDPVETTGRVAFVTTHGASSAIFVAQSDGRGARQLTHPRSPHDSVGEVDWSPDGTWIAYSGGLGGWNDNAYDDLFVVKTDGSGLRRLTRTYEDDWVPTWSPDGETIAFDRNDDGYNWVYVADADGAAVRRLTPNLHWHPAWSPSGGLAYVDGRAIWVMNGDGTKKRKLARAEVELTGYGTQSPLAWSPDEKSIVFTSGTALWLISSDGRERRSLFGVPNRQSGYPVWSPVGRSIAFTQGDGDLEVFVINADGSGLRNLTDNKRIQDVNPVWSPDGRAIAYITDRDGATEIYVMNADGGGSRNLSNSPGEDCCHAWSP